MDEKALERLLLMKLHQKIDQSTRVDEVILEFISAFPVDFIRQKYDELKDKEKQVILDRENSEFKELVMDKDAHTNPNWKELNSARSTFDEDSPLSSVSSIFSHSKSEDNLEAIHSDHADDSPFKSSVDVNTSDSSLADSSSIDRMMFELECLKKDRIPSLDLWVKKAPSCGHDVSTRNVRLLQCACYYLNLQLEESDIVTLLQNDGFSLQELKLLFSFLRDSFLPDYMHFIARRDLRLFYQKRCKTLRHSPSLTSPVPIQLPSLECNIDNIIDKMCYFNLKSFRSEHKYMLYSKGHFDDKILDHIYLHADNHAEIISNVKKEHGGDSSSYHHHLPLVVCGVTRHAQRLKGGYRYQLSRNAKFFVLKVDLIL